MPYWRGVLGIFARDSVRKLEFGIYIEPGPFNVLGAAHGLRIYIEPDPFASLTVCDGKLYIRHIKFLNLLSPIIQSPRNSKS